MELVQNVRPISVQRVCDKCGKGLLQFNKNLNPHSKLEGSVIYFNHKCTNCDNTKFFNTAYPYIVHVGTENLREPTEEEKLSIYTVDELE